MTYSCGILKPQKLNRWQQRERSLRTLCSFCYLLFNDSELEFEFSCGCVARSSIGCIGDSPSSALSLGFALVENVSHFWELILGTIIALLPLINPLASAPTFLAITEGDTRERRLQQLRHACFYMVAILVSFLVGGTFIMGFFGISIPGLRIAGGLLVAGIGSRMLMGPAPDPSRRDPAEEEARAKRDVSFSPLAMPMLSGPGSIAVTIGFTSLASHWHDYVAIIIGIVTVAGITYIALGLSERIVLVIGVNGMNALSKVMGFLILCIGIQFVVNGVLGIATDPAVLRTIREAVQIK
jgi:multiple antibiotic resistance protein